MKVFKKIFAAFTAAFTAAVLAVPCFSVSAAEKSLTPANNAPYTVLMGIEADIVNNKEGELWDQSGNNFQTITTDGDYKVSYVIDKTNTSGKNIKKLVLDTNMKKESLPGVVITVNSVSLVKGSDGTIVNIPCDASKAVQTKNDNECHKLIILDAFGQPPIKAIDPVMPDYAKNDELTITFNISGLAPAQQSGTSDTSASSDAGSGSGAGTTSYTTTAAIFSSGSTAGNTGTVSQTADPGVVAIVVAGAGAAALAVGAITLRRRKK